MKILLVGDIHYALKQLDWLCSVAPDYDVVVVAGDLLELSSIVDLPSQSVVVRRYLERLGDATQLVVCSGNHDLTEEAATGERFAGWLNDIRGSNVVRDGDCLRIGSTVISVFPWWDGPESKALVDRQMRRDQGEVTEGWLWVYHAPPAESPTSWAGTRHFGDPALANWISYYAPDYVLCGHVHQAPFIPDGAWVDRVGPSWVFNMGQQPGEVPASIVIDTSKGAAVWSSFEGLQSVDLNRAVAEPKVLTEPPAWFRA